MKTQNLFGTILNWLDFYGIHPLTLNILTDKDGMVTMCSGDLSNNFPYQPMHRKLLAQKFERFKQREPRLSNCELVFIPSSSSFCMKTKTTNTLIPSYSNDLLEKLAGI